MRNRRGFLLEPLTWALIGIAYMTAAFWGIAYTMSGQHEQITKWF